MFLSAIVLCGLAVVLFGIFYTNKFVRLVAMYFLILAVNLVVGILYLSRVTLYSPLSDIDYKLYIWLYHIKIPFTTLVRMFNVSFSMYMFGAIIFSGYLRRISTLKKLLMMIGPISFGIFNDPILGQIIHIKTYTGSGIEQKIMKMLPVIFSTWNKVMVFVYIFLPIVFMFIAYQKTVIYVKKRDIAVSTICVFVINFFVYVFQIRGIFYNIMFDNVNFVKVPLEYSYRDYGVILPRVMWVMIAVILVLIFLLKPFETISNRSAMSRRREWKQINGNLSMFLHTYKNAFIGISQRLMLIEAYLGQERYENAMECTKQGQAITEETLRKLENTLRLLRSIRVDLQAINLVECIKKALEKSCSNHAHIIFDLDCPYDEIFIKGDYNHITECFLNLLNNAIQAVDAKKNHQGRIQIHVILEEELVMVEITDNGVGIKKENRKKIFQPFFSTKSCAGGVGLNYVANIIKLHSGKYRVRSREGAYTTFQIVFAVCRKTFIKNKYRKIWRRER